MLRRILVGFGAIGGAAVLWGSPAWAAGVHAGEFCSQSAVGSTTRRSRCLRRPVCAPTARSATSGSRGNRSTAPPVTPPSPKSGFENLEDEMASLLGRPKNLS